MYYCKLHIIGQYLGTLFAQKWSWKDLLMITGNIKLYTSPVADPEEVARAPPFWGKIEAKGPKTFQ